MAAQRILSLLPAATEMVFLLGAGERLVGRSHECDFPQAAHGIPIVSRTRIDPSQGSARIDAAVKHRLENGAVEEVRAVRDIASGTARQILGWREIVSLLDGRTTMEQCREQLAVATRQYAKRQLTWFRGRSTLPEENISAVTSDTLDRLALSLGLS
jgi:tRNA A37 N6-isopentenylltransferase MiaA